jgi:hypothetical protein
MQLWRCECTSKEWNWIGIISCWFNADDVNLLGENIYNVKNNIEAFSNEISVVGNIEKANRIFLPPEHKAEQKYNIQISDKSFAYVAKFKCVGKKSNK